MMEIVQDFYLLKLQEVDAVISLAVSLLIAEVTV